MYNNGGREHKDDIIGFVLSTVLVAVLILTNIIIPYI